MVEAIWGLVQAALGIGRDAEEINAAQMAVRTIVTYGFTLGIIRLGSKRFLSKATAFDVIVAIMLGSIMSRAIDGSTSMVSTFIVGAVLVGTHWMLSLLALHTNWFGYFVKGERVLLIEGGKIQEEGMRQSGITMADLKQALRLQTNQEDPSKVRRAYLERSGDISVVPVEDEPQVFDVSVEDGVQTVRIKLGS